MTKQIEALKLALEGAANYIDALGGDSRKYRQALAEQPAQQEPVACANGCRGFVKYPAQRTWVGLTDEQWQSIADTLGCIITRSQKDAIEATIGIKENT